MIGKYVIDLTYSQWKNSTFKPAWICKLALALIINQGQKFIKPQLKYLISTEASALFDPWYSQRNAGVFKPKKI